MTRFEPLRFHPEYLEHEGVREYLLNIGIQCSKEDTYLCLGEVGDTAHYVFLHLNSGNILPGMWHLEDFEPQDGDNL